ncbi:hypothetical protein Tco_1139854 [Tanacetum coccineum]
MKNFDWGKVKTTDEIMGQVMAKYGKYNLLEDDSWGDIILDDIIHKFYRDELEETEVGKENDKGKGKVDDKGKGIMDDKGKGIMDDVLSIVDRLEKGNKGTKKTNVNLVDAKKPKKCNRGKVLEEVDEVSSVEEDSRDLMFKEKPTSSTATTSTALIASTSNAQVVAPRGYMKIPMTLQFDINLPNAVSLHKLLFGYAVCKLHFAHVIHLQMQTAYAG